jgi:hypothetical protein
MIKLGIGKIKHNLTIVVVMVKFIIKFKGSVFNYKGEVITGPATYNLKTYDKGSNL